MISFFRRARTFYSSFAIRCILRFNVKDLKVASFIVFAPKGEVHVGEGFFAGECLYVSTNELCELTIGESVMFGPSVYILGGNHNYRYAEGHLKNCQICDTSTKSIKIENGVWVGANSTILSGSNIGEGAIVGANSLVSHYIPPYVMAVGSPAKKFIARFTCDELARVLLTTKSEYSFSQMLEIYESHSVALLSE